MLVRDSALVGLQALANGSCVDVAFRASRHSGQAVNWLSGDDGTRGERREGRGGRAGCPERACFKRSTRRFAAGHLFAGR